MAFSEDGRGHQMLGCTGAGGIEIDLTARESACFRVEDAVREFDFGLAIGKPGIAFYGCAANGTESFCDAARIF